MGALLAAARVAYNAALLPLALLFRLFPRRPERWTFAGAGATRFADNSAWLFLWVRENHPEIKATWVTRSPQVRRRLRKAGVPAALEWTPRGLWIQTRAAVTVLSHGPGDAYHPATVGSYRVNLWHGLPVKHIMLDHPPDHAAMRPDGAWRRLAVDIRRMGLRRGPDLLLAMTPAGRKRMEQASGLPPERTSDAGFPRLQALTVAAPAWPFAEDVAQAQALRSGKALMVLFFPTWGTDAKAREALLGPAVLSWLEANDAVLVLKPHPNDPGFAGDPSWRGLVKVAPRALDAMLLMAEADVMVTDVSSAFVDMLAAGKPVVLVRTVWGRELRGFYDLPEEFVRTPVATDADSLAKALADARKWVARGKANATPAATPWLDTHLERSCERVFSEIQARRPRPRREARE